MPVAAQVNGGKLPQNVVPFCVGGGLLAAAIPLVSELLQQLLRQLAPQGPYCKAGTHQRSSSRLSRTSGLGDEQPGPPSMAMWCRVQALRLSLWLLPSGIGFAVGMYVSPRWTIPRVIGSAIEQAWLRADATTHRNLMVIIASGLVLGEGVASILNAAMQAACKQHSCRAVFC